MDKVGFVFGIHNHQPAGNFDHVIEESFRMAYQPFLEAFSRRTSLRMVLHQSGTLWEWMERHHPDYLEKVASLVESGRIEILSGGFHEPILTIIPRRDAVRQIERLTDFIEDRFGTRPRGIWLAERVWSPELPLLLSDLGIGHLALDGSHFGRTGLDTSRLDGCYITEHEGGTVRIFPIDEVLRYTIPFRDINETMKRLGEFRDRPGGGLVTMIDDGEKFGSWPGTHDLVYGSSWLERFFDAVEEADWIETTTLSDAVDSSPPGERVYIPESSYMEMMEWALDPEARARGEKGGIFRNFLARYSESNLMQKKALLVSEKVASMSDGPLKKKAEDLLHRGEVNCPYWHGIFGGIYINFLRGAVWKSLTSAEALAGVSPGVIVRDLDCDGREDIRIASNDLVAWFAPGWGGEFNEVSDLSTGENLLDIVMRRREAYHESDGGMGIGRLHDGIASGPMAPIIHDPYPRGRLVDILLPGDEQIPGETIERGEYGEPIRFPLDFSISGEKVDIAMPYGRKTIGISGKCLSIEYRPDGPLSLATEIAIPFLAAESPGRRYDIPGRTIEDPRPISRGWEGGIEMMSGLDEERGFRMDIRISPPAAVYRFPVETVSNSPLGNEVVYQASVVVVVFRGVTAARLEITTG